MILIPTPSAGGNAILSRYPLCAVCTTTHGLRRRPTLAGLGPPVDYSHCQVSSQIWVINNGEIMGHNSAEHRGPTADYT